MIVCEHEREACGDHCLDRRSQVNDIVLSVIAPFDVSAVDRLQHRRPRREMERHIIVQIATGLDWNQLQGAMPLDSLEGDVGKADTFSRHLVLGKQP